MSCRFEKRGKGRDDADGFWYRAVDVFFAAVAIAAFAYMVFQASVAHAEGGLTGHFHQQSWLGRTGAGALLRIGARHVEITQHGNIHIRIKPRHVFQYPFGRQF